MKIYRADLLIIPDRPLPQMKVWDTEMPKPHQYFDPSGNFSHQQVYEMKMEEWLQSFKTYDVKQECVIELKSIVWSDFVKGGTLELTDYVPAFDLNLKTGITLPEDVRERIEIVKENVKYLKCCTKCETINYRVSCEENGCVESFAILKPLLPKTEEGNEAVEFLEKLEMHIMINEHDWNRNPQAMFQDFKKSLGAIIRK